MDNNERIFIRGKEVASKQYVDNKAVESTTAYYYRWDGSTGAEAKAMFSEVVKLAKANKIIHVYVDQDKSPYKLRRYTGTITNGSFDNGSRTKHVTFNMYQLDRSRTSTSDGISYYINKEVCIKLEYDENYDVIDISSYDNTNHSLTINSDVVSKSYLTAQISKAIGNISSFSLLPVEALPTENIQTNIIYAVPSENPEENDERVEWVYVNEKWECLGTRKIDLSNYYNKTEVDALLLTSGGLQVLDATDANNPIDFNDYVEPGTMYLVKGGNFVNGPSTTRSEWGDWGYLINNNKPEIQKKVYQTYVTVPYCFTNGGITINHNIYYRSKSTSTTTSTWSSWSERDPLTSEYSRDWMNELRDVIGLSQRGAYNMYKELTTITGALQSLGTTDKTSLVNAINELNSKIGDINSILETMTDVEGASE